VRVKIEYFPADGSPNQFGESAVPDVEGITDVQFSGQHHTFKLKQPEHIQNVLQELSAQRVVSGLRRCDRWDWLGLRWEGCLAETRRRGGKKGVRHLLYFIFFLCVSAPPL